MCAGGAASPVAASPLSFFACYPLLDHVVGGGCVHTGSVPARIDRFFFDTCAAGYPGEDRTFESVRSAMAASNMQ